MDAERKPFDSWAIVELMGHHQVAGRVTEESLAGQNMLRIDVPELGPERPGCTKYFGGSSIYAIHPCSEQLARQAAERLAKNWGFAPLPVAVPDLTQAMDVIRRAEALRERPALVAGNPGNSDNSGDVEKEFEDWEG